MPFMPDIRIIHTAGTRDIRAEHTLVQWRDGSEYAVHQVCENGVPHTHLRAIRHPGLVGADLWWLFDLRHLDSALAHELALAHQHDRRGLLFYGLRLGWPSADAFVEQVRALQSDPCPLPA